MRLLVLFLLILMIDDIEASGQKISFTDSTNVWQVYHTGGGSLQDAFIDIHMYSHSRDTMIGANSYRVMSDSVWKWSYAWLGFPIQYQGPYLWDSLLVREDTATKEVFVRIDSNDYLLYDFDQQIGDTFHNWQATFVVASIDSVVINTTFHKRWHYIYVNGQTSTGQYDVIDGIGSMEGLLNRTTFEDNWNLLCFSSGSVFQSSVPVVSPYRCNMSSILSVDEIEKSLGDPLFVNPNPIVTSAIISLPYRIIRGRFDIADYSGKVVRSEPFFSSDELHVQNAFPPGLYVFHIIDKLNGKSFFGKFEVK
jgi:hypothetical protein